MSRQGPVTTKHGPFIVIDGADACGKATQVELLLARLKADNRRPYMIDFPRYENASSHFVQRYLKGDYGTVETVNAQTASIFFALDRYDAKLEITAAQAAGRVILANRFSSSSLAHQGSKIEDAAERERFMAWVEELEFELLGIPQPTVTIIMDVPFEISAGLMAERAHRDKIALDIQEKNVRHQRVARQIYLTLCERNPEKFKLVNCVSDQGAMLPPAAIQQIVWQIVEPYLS